MAKWPNVPACYGWLSLDRRGNWQLQGERLAHSGLIAFLNQHYGCDQSGRWFVQNGPQRVFVHLAYTPWIVRITPEGLLAHTGQPAGRAQACFVDEEGNVLLLTERGIALLDDRDLSIFINECRQSDDVTVDEETLHKIMAGEPSRTTWQNLLLQSVRRDEMAQKFSFQPNPLP